MASIIEYGGITPKLHESVFVAHGAVILGDVEIGEHSSVWFNCVLRGDVHEIRIGSRTNIQDLTMCHTTYNKHPLHIGNNVTIGHHAMLHGCTVGNSVLVGMQATLLDGSVIGNYSMVAAGTVVRQGFVVPDGVLVAGVPGKIIRELTQQERTFLDESAQNYIDYIHSYRNHYNVRTQRGHQ
ncbi:MAG: gamma carbonic anhydrase family protein [Chlorobi bacterium]|nr:MAG: gamma carbonic anhydrase family protein [Bacteroidota bacterium]KXK34210.1 MAG: CysE/LacA/LpxA/NodL family acetyltransferase [Chlorobi bacterium OLB6]MBE2266255.1 gamma carbonic anhydrase family protein [Flavobacteriales bacterium]MBL1161071.1 gamma carbonic anhydrase family protein [Chlorobiota bacterium]MBW7854272.1 gamma carbonic anhydrase family protein [Candidatus Kapabacteria bacterium]MCC6331015.1 gamma carbonic anhydrase family protein [Ignavibacteria bacterium]